MCVRVIEDEEDLAEMVADGLRSSGIVADIASTAAGRRKGQRQPTTAYWSWTVNCRVSGEVDAPGLGQGRLAPGEPLGRLESSLLTELPPA